MIEKSREEMDGRFEEWKALLQSGQNDDGKIQRGLEKGAELYGMVVRNERHRKIIRLMNQISSKRNDINHFGFTVHPASAERLEKKLETEAAEFKMLQAEWDS